MNSLMMSIRNENGGLRGLTGSGEPGLFTLLGGTGVEEGANAYRMTGGAGQVSSVARVASAHRDVRLAAVASGTSGAGQVSGSGVPAGGYRPPDRPATQAR